MHVTASGSLHLISVSARLLTASMFFLRSRLSLVTAAVLGGHVTALAAAALALCCFSHVETPEPGDHCPLHLGDSGPSSSYVGDRAGIGGHAAHGLSDDASPASRHTSGDNGQVCCDDEFTPEVAFGSPALMTSAVMLLSRPSLAQRVEDRHVSGPTVPSRIEIPPPRA